MTRARILLIALGVAWLTPTPAQALLCSPFLGCSCNVTASDLSFGDIQPLLGAPAAGVADVTVTCTGVIDVLPSVTARVGPGLYGSIGDRRMQSPGGEQLAYNLYTSPLYAAIAGEGAGGYPALTIDGGLITLGTWTATAHLYGRVPPAPAAKPATYADTVTVLIEW